MTSEKRRNRQGFDSLRDAAMGGLVVFGVTFGAAAVGGIASAGAQTFYAELTKPAWAPSAAVFGPVWTVLYLLMAVSALLVVREIGWRAAATPLTVFAVQLVLNAAWTWLFFAWRLGGGALADILLLACLIAVNAWQFWRVRPVAGAMLIPYLAWVCFAALLTWNLWQSNPGLL